MSGAAGLEMRREPFPIDFHKLLISRWGIFRRITDSTSGRPFVGFVVDDGVDPTCYEVVGCDGFSDEYVGDFLRRMNDLRDRRRAEYRLGPGE